MTDGPHLRNWSEVDGEEALRHGIAGQPFEIKFLASSLRDWLGLPGTKEAAWLQLRGLGLSAGLLYLVCLARLAAQDDHLQVSIDILISDIGWCPRSTFERLQMRRTVWRWLTAFDGWTVIGDRRRGHYRDPVTKRVPELWIDSALFRIIERGYVEPAQLAFDASTPPFEVTLAAGPWLSQFRGNRQILAYFGDVRRLAAIPARKVGGAWAHSVGLTLNQRWRERAADAEVLWVGEEKHLTTLTGDFTRRDLLSLFPPNPSLDQVLSGPHPSRAKNHWRDAISALKEQDVIGYYKELTDLPSRRQDWERDWLEQPLDIRPTAKGNAAIAEIAKAARAARRARSGSRKLR